MFEPVEGIPAQFGQDGTSEIARGTGVDESTVAATILEDVIGGLGGH